MRRHVQVSKKGQYGVGFIPAVLCTASVPATIAGAKKGLIELNGTLCGTS
jgi:hypothetical protein